MLQILHSNSYFTEYEYLNTLRGKSLLTGDHITDVFTDAKDLS